MRQLKALSLFLFIPMLLCGCMYPNAKKQENQIPYKDQIQAVQSAVDQFQKDKGGILPIVTKNAETPIFQKYVIDFKKIKPYIAEPPGNAFESGGVFQYVLVNPETDPTVKLLDVRMAQQIQDLKLRLESYRQDHGYPPYSEVLAEGVYTLDYDKLGMKEEPTVTSPYSRTELHFLVNNEAEVFVDYTPDLYEALKTTKTSVKEGEDIRPILLEDSDFVPAFSLPYTLDKPNTPVFLTK